MWLSLASAQSQPYTFTTIAGLAHTKGFTDGTNGSARFYDPKGIDVDPAGNLFLSHDVCKGIRKITHIGTDWVVTTLGAGAFAYPAGIALNATGDIYVVDYGNHSIAKVAQNGTNWVVNYLVGDGTHGDQDGTNRNARFYYPIDVAVSAAGNLFVTDYQNCKIKMVAPVGTNWVVTTIAGARGGGSDDGTNTHAGFYGPRGIAIDKGGSLFVADSVNNTIRKITPIGTDWVVTTVAGLAGVSGSSNGTNSEARFKNPHGVAVDAQGSLYVTEVSNHTVRKLKPSGTNWIVTTIAGMSGNHGTNNGTGVAARFCYPLGICVDSSGTLFVADSLNYTVRLGEMIPALAFQFADSQMTLSWPRVASNYVLEAKSELGGPGSWSPLTNGVVVSGEELMRVNQLTAPAAFYRLRKQ